MFFSSKFRWVALSPRHLKNDFYQQRTATISAGTEEDGGNGIVAQKHRIFSDPDERRGYRYDGMLDLTALIDKASSMGFINTADADGFKARNFRTGAEPPDPEKAKEIIVFFKNRAKPVIPAKDKPLKSTLQHGSRDTTLSRSKEDGSLNRMKTSPNVQHPTRQTPVVRKMHAQINNQGTSSSQIHQPPRGNYKISKPQKK